MDVSLGDIAGMIAALAFAFLVFRLGSVIRKARKILDETRIGVRSTTENVQPTLVKLTDTVSLTNDQLAGRRHHDQRLGHHHERQRLTALFAATLGSPVVKVAAFTCGVRTALSGNARSTRGARRRRRG